MNLVNIYDFQLTEVLFLNECIAFDCAGYLMPLKWKSTQCMVLAYQLRDHMFTT